MCLSIGLSAILAVHCITKKQERRAAAACTGGASCYEQQQQQSGGSSSRRGSEVRRSSIQSNASEQLSPIDSNVPSQEATPLFGPHEPSFGSDKELVEAPTCQPHRLHPRPRRRVRLLPLGSATL